MAKTFNTTLFELCVCILACSAEHTSSAIDNNHFYRACYFWGEPRFEKKLLTSVDVTVGGGWSHHGLNTQGHRVPLLDTWGMHDIHALAKGVPGLSTQDPLKQLSDLPACDRLGLVSCTGKFSIAEAQVNWLQNFSHGFFSQAHLPLRSFHISHICITDFCTTTTPNPLWTTIRPQLIPLLNKHGLWVGSENESGIGDTTLLLGWTINYEHTKTIDYADFTVKTGVLAPTGRARQEDHPFSLPLGYNKHWALPVSAVYALGLFEWFTAGVFGDSLFFFDRTYTLRMKTALCQSGLFKLASGCAQVHQGTLWDLGGYVKIDHAGSALSLILGYTYAAQTATKLHPRDSTLFDYAIVNSDAYYRGWNMHTLHLSAEYDLSAEEKRLGERIGFFYDAVLAGHRVFKTGILGASLGLDVQWRW